MSFNMSQEFYDNINEGGKYICDKCQVAELNANEYDNYIQWQYHYCEPCWNYIHLKSGTCKCGARHTNRSEYAKILIECGCGNKVELTW